MARTITVTIIASNADEAVGKFHASPAAAKLGDAVQSVEPIGWKSERHHLYEVEMVLAADADAEQVWFWLTSYGMSPSKALGSKLGAAADRYADAQV